MPFSGRLRSGRGVGGAEVSCRLLISSDIVERLTWNCQMGGPMVSDPKKLINFSQPAENNRGPILTRLSELLVLPATVLEIGSGSGQHAIAFGAALPHLTWQPSDQGDYFDGLERNLHAHVSPNVLAPIRFDIVDEPWAVAGIDHLYAANVLHIAAEAVLAPLFRQVAAVLTPGGLVCLYGPYRYGGRFTTASNEQFDAWLKSRNPLSGIRDIEVVTQIAADNGLILRHDFSMPANNQFLVFAFESAGR